MYVLEDFKYYLVKFNLVSFFNQINPALPCISITNQECYYIENKTDSLKISEKNKMVEREQYYGLSSIMVPVA